MLLKSSPLWVVDISELWIFLLVGRSLNRLFKEGSWDLVFLEWEEYEAMVWADGEELGEKVKTIFIF